MTADIIGDTRRLADEVLFPRAMDVDRADLLPAALLDAIAAAGLYGAAAPPEAGGLDFPELCAVTEELASGCLAAAFVWIQHGGLLRSLASQDAPAALRNEWLGPAFRGELRGGIALAGLVPGPPQLRAGPDNGGWRLDGASPWVTGWGLVDLILVAARGPDDTIVRLVMDAAPQPGLTVTRQHLVAVDASAAVRLDFAGVRIPAGRVLGQEPFDPSAGRNPMTLRLNGSLALGVVSRCARLAGPGTGSGNGSAPGDGLSEALSDQLTACRKRLDDAVTDPAPEAMAEARAAASELAVRATTALIVHAGSRSVMTDQHAQRLAREALFLLVFGSRPGIKTALLRRLSSPDGDAPSAR